MTSDHKRILAEKILNLVRGSGGEHAGISREGILNQLDTDISDRTLLRHLSDLLAAGMIVRTGAARSTKYVLQRQSVIGEPRPASGRKSELVLSDVAKNIKKEVAQTEVRTKRVRYDFTFLENYVPGKTWFLDGQTRANLAHQGSVFDEVRPAGTYARQIFNRLMIDLSWASSHLEGNTYTLLDTRLLLEKGQEAKGKDAEETQMILNHKSAIEIMVESEEILEFNRLAILNLHAVLSQGLLADHRDEGRLRRHAVFIGGTNYTPLSIPQQIEEYFDLLLEKTQAIPDPFEQAFFFMMHLAYLQPFSDVNKRVSRVGANIPLIKANLCPLSFMDVPRDLYLKGVLGVYLLNRHELLKEVFVYAYERSASRYKIVRETVVEPNLTRLKYRTQLFAWVRKVVLSRKLLSRDLLEGFLFEDIPEEDWSAFEELLLEEMLNLHEGNCLRYGIQLQDFASWKMSQ